MVFWIYEGEEMRVYADFETEGGTILQFKQAHITLPEHLQGYPDNELIACPICHIATWRTKVGKVQSILTRTFFEFVAEVEKWNKSTKYIDVLYHNLSFDFTFIMAELFHRGYRHIQHYSENVEVENPEELKPKTFVIYGSNIQKASAIQIMTENKCYTLIDTLKHYKGSLEKWAKTYNVTKKGNYDFNNHKLGTNYRKIIDYCKNDTISLMECVEAHIKGYGVKKMPWTASSASMANFKKQEENYKNLFPTLTEEQRLFSNFAYHGGITILHEKFKGVELSNISGYDIKSSYPYQMAYHSYPISTPKETKRLIENCYGEYLCYVSFKIKDGLHPCLRVHRNEIISNLFGYPANKQQFTRYVYPKEWQGYLILSTTQIETLNLFYDYDIKIIRGYAYQVEYGIFTEYIEELFTLKDELDANGDYAGVAAIKVFINSLYGKFGQDLTGRNRIYAPVGGYETFKIGEKVVEKKWYKSTDLKGVYTPVASHTTALAVNHLMKTINADPQRFIYGDTDSAYFHDTDFKPVIGNKLGEWGYIEKDCNNFQYGKFLGKKLYMYETSTGRQIVKAVGMNDTTRKLVTRENFQIGAQFPTVKFKQVTGGTIAFDTLYTIQERIVRE